MYTIVTREMVVRYPHGHHAASRFCGVRSSSDSAHEKRGLNGILNGHVSNGFTGDYDWNGVLQTD